MASSKKKTASKKKAAPKKKSTSKKKVVAKKKVVKKTATASAKPRAKKPSAAADARVTRLKTLISLFEKSELGELSYEDSDVRVTLRGKSTAIAASDYIAPVVASSPVSAAAAPTATNQQNAAKNEVSDSDDSHQVICSPFVGTFYTAPSPDADPYTKVGQAVSQGQTVCIVEAMKLMNEIEAEVAGTVVEILAENGQGVQYGDPLFKIKVG